MYDTQQFEMLKCEKKKYVLGSIKYSVSISGERDSASSLAVCMLREG